MSAHVHSCPVCYDDAICGLACNTSFTTSDEDEERGIRRGEACVCRACLKRAGMPLDAYTTALAADPGSAP